MKRFLCFNLIIWVWIIQNLETVSTSKWDYKAINDWTGYCSTGTKQSPINVPLNGRVKSREVPLKLESYEYGGVGKYVSFDVLNNGHTGKISLVKQPSLYKVKISGGGLGGTFAFAQLHFHWGQTDDVGSEHTISNVSYPLEMHLVHYNTLYGYDLNSAVSVGNGAQDTLAVLGVLFTLVDQDNPELNELISTLNEIKTTTGLRKIVRSFSLRNVLPRNINSFIRYQGSLTTPTCDEIVLWTVFQDTVEISARQLAKFRELQTANGHMLVQNYRPVQPINNRVIYDIYTGSTGTKPLKNSVYISLALFFVNMMLLISSY